MRINPTSLRCPAPETMRPTHVLLVRTIGPRLMEKDGDSTASFTFRQERPSEFLEGIVSQSDDRPLGFVTYQS